MHIALQVRKIRSRDEINLISFGKVIFFCKVMPKLETVSNGKIQYYYSFQILLFSSFSNYFLSNEKCCPGTTLPHSNTNLKKENWIYVFSTEYQSWVFKFTQKYLRRPNKSSDELETSYLNKKGWKNSVKFKISHR